MAREVVVTTEKDVPFLGRITWYSVPEETWPFPQVDGLLDEHRIPEDVRPRHTRSVDAFKNAVRDAAKGTAYVVTYGTKTDDAGNEVRDPSVMLVVRNEADPENRTLPVVLRVKYDAEHQTISYEDVSQDAELMGFLRMRIDERYTTYREAYRDSDLRTMLSKGLRKGLAFMLKPNGSVYFVPEDAADLTRRLATVVNTLGCDMVTIPVVDRAPERGTLIAKYEKETLGRIEALMGQARAVVAAGGDVTPSVLNRFLKEVEYLQEQRRKYEAILSTTMGKVEVEVDVLKAYLVKLADRMATEDDDEGEEGGKEAA